MNTVADLTTVPGARADRQRRVVITGMGVASPLGNTVESFFDGLLAGVPSFTPSPDLDGALVSTVPDTGWETAFNGRTRRYTDRCTRLALAASRQAVRQARVPLAGDAPAAGGYRQGRRGRAASLAQDALDPGLGEVATEDVGVYIGSSVGGIASLWDDFSAAAVGTVQDMTPFVLPRTLINMIGGNVSIDFGFLGESIGYASACASGTVAIGEAYRKIRSGQVRMAVAGGAESCTIPSVLVPFQKVGAMSRTTDPERAMRPFATDREGFVMAEGAGILVLESAESAFERGVPILGEIAGYHSTSDAVSLLAPDRAGIQRCVQGLCDRADWAPEDVVYINAHGTGTVLNDQMESAVFTSVFPHHPSVSSTKATYGHPLGAGGGFEAIACVEALRRRLAPPNGSILPEEIDPELSLNLVLGGPARLPDGGVALSTSFAFGGQNAAVAFRALDAGLVE